MWLQYTPWRVSCSRCGVKVERVPWADGSSVFTAAFEESVAYLAQVTDRTPVSRLLGISWVAVGNIVERVVARRLDGAPDQGMGARLLAARWGQVSESARSARPGAALRALPRGRCPGIGPLPEADNRGLASAQ